ncbi:MAG: YraN family protein [Planctomycetota bacterium]
MSARVAVAALSLARGARAFVLASLRPERALRRHALGQCRLANAELGWLGERCAARELRARGVVVVAQRLATKLAELDLVARDGRELVVIEVKTGRLGARFRPGDRFDVERARRLADAAGRLAVRLPVVAWRVELFEVGLHDDGSIEFTRTVSAREEVRAWPAPRSTQASLRT